MSYIFKISIGRLVFILGNFILLSKFKIALLKNQAFWDMTLLKGVSDMSIYNHSPRLKGLIKLASRINACVIIIISSLPGMRAATVIHIVICILFILFILFIIYKNRCYYWIWNLYTIYANTIDIIVPI